MLLMIEPVTNTDTGLGCRVWLRSADVGIWGSACVSFGSNVSALLYKMFETRM